MKILITGCAGFIGFHLAKRLLEENHSICGIDNLNDYYDVNLKKARLAILKKHNDFTFEKIDLSDHSKIEALFRQNKFDVVVNLAAQAGVRPSLEKPLVYIESNITGFCNILEGCRHTKVKHLIYASSSSVYGLNANEQSLKENQNTDQPLSIYAATKKANELMAYSYSNLYQLPCTGLRLFTVYGPWGRPDMATFKFTKNILNKTPIEIYGDGNAERDFTYIDDVVESFYRVLILPPPAQDDQQNPTKEENNVNIGSPPSSIYNVGNHNPVKLIDFISLLEEILGKKATKHFSSNKPGDALITYADTLKFRQKFNFKPNTQIIKGMERFVRWYLEYYK